MQLKTLYPTLDSDQRERLAVKAGIKAPYLWQIATRWNGRRPSIDLIVKLAAADKRLSVPELVKEFSEAKLQRTKQKAEA